VKVEEKKAQKEREVKEKKLNNLKATLYTKFGNSINLEE
jgi:hypothetical protein